MGFPVLKMISTWGVKWGETHHLRKHLYDVSPWDSRLERFFLLGTGSSTVLGDLVEIFS